MSPSTPSVAAINGTVQFSATPRDAQGNTLTGRTVTWSSTATAVATISESGLATAAANGTTTISATVDGVAGTTTLTVSQQGDALRIAIQPAGAMAGLPFATQPVVEVLDANGNIVENDDATVVVVSVASADAEVIGEGTVAVQGGIATYADLAIGGIVGEHTLTFASGELAPVVSVPFMLAAGPAAVLTLEGGNGQIALADTQLPEALSVAVHDAFGNGIADVPVAWAITDGGGSLSAAQVPTNDDGVSSVNYRLGRFAISETIEAAVAELGGSPIAFMATATPNGRITGTIGVTNQLMSVAAKDATAVGRTFARPAALARNGSRRAPDLAGLSRPSRIQPVPQPAARFGPAEYVPGELLVTYRAAALGAPLAGAQAYRARATAQAVATSMRTALAAHERTGRLDVRGVSPAILSARVLVTEPGTLASVEQALRADPAVAHVERNALAWSFSDMAPLRRRPATAPVTAALPGDPLFPFQAWHYRMIDLPRAWDITTGSASVVVAVLDDGIRFDHPDLAPNLTADGYDFVSDNALIPVCAGGSVGNAGDGDGYDSDPTIPASVIMDPDLDCITGLSETGGHGTHVAGTIGAAGNDGFGATGVNWNVAIRPVRVLDIRGSGTIYDIAQGILYAAGLPADDGAGGTVTAPSAARIINMSLGAPTDTEIQRNAVIAATNAGSLIVASSGNDASSAPNYPAAYPEVLSVSAVGPDATLASYSSFGPTVDIAAPGGEMAGGCYYGVISTTWNFVSSAPNHECFQGTSMAAPHVSGVAALILADQPGLSASQVRARLVDFAVDAGPAGLDDQYGAGIVNARNSLTQSFAPAASLYARLIDASTGSTVATVPAANGSYSFTGLADGNYVVFAGQDESGDGNIGVPLRRWGASGGTATPGVVTVSGAGDYPASFQIGLPTEVEPNDDLGNADVLAVGGYLLGTILDPSSDVDVYRIRIPIAGSYTFETSAVAGACGFALEEDTDLGLYDNSGALMTSNENIDAAAFNFCSRINTTLQPGTYYIGVFGNVGGRYAVSAREGT